MTVPEDFEIPEADRQAIESAGIRLLPQPQRLSLTEAIRDAVQRLDPPGPLRLLYGDTLVRQAETTPSDPIRDRVVVKHTTANYPWAMRWNRTASSAF